MWNLLLCQEFWKVTYKYWESILTIVKTFFKKSKQPVHKTILQISFIIREVLMWLVTFALISSSLSMCTTVHLKPSDLSVHNSGAKTQLRIMFLCKLTCNFMLQLLDEHKLHGVASKMWTWKTLEKQHRVSLFSVSCLKQMKLTH